MKDKTGIIEDETLALSTAIVRKLEKLSNLNKKVRLIKSKFYLVENFLECG